MNNMLIDYVIAYLNKRVRKNVLMLNALINCISRIALDLNDWFNVYLHMNKYKILISIVL